MKLKSLQNKRKRGFPKGHHADNVSLDTIRDLTGADPLQRDCLIEYLHLIQDKYQCLPQPLLIALAECLQISPVEVFEVASFYHHFDLVIQAGDKPAELTVRVCDSISCQLNGADELIKDLQGITGNKLRIHRVPCVGRCDKAPVAVVGTNPVELASVDKVQQVIDDGHHRVRAAEAQSYATYRSLGGYSLYEELGTQHSVNVCLEIIEQANLRGLGGAGFPAAQKWKIVRGFVAPRLMAVNIDEGEPGTFKDRFYLEKKPHQFLEGMLIAAKIVEAEKIVIYIRDEYTAIRLMLINELELIKKALKDIPPIVLRRGAGAYICGEESAMIESIEGKRGMPRLRPPYIAEKGLFGKPTLEHNMETLYWIPEILKHGSDWFNQYGRNGRKGLRSYSVSGRVKKPGVYLAPAGISVRELIDEFCGGMLDGQSLKAYFPGGASGGILPASLDHVPLDFDTLQAYDCFIGSAAIIVLSESDSVKQAALNAMRFFAHESCGQCTPCRVGTEKAAQLMAEQNWNQGLLQELATTMIDASICGLGQAAPNPMLCAMRYFPEEF